MKLLPHKSGELQVKLKGYIEKDQLYSAVFEYTKSRFEEATHLPAHNWAHAYRDTLNAIFIGEAEAADMAIVLPAITMHDIGFLYGADGKTHGEVGAENLKAYLETGEINYPEAMLEKIAACIRTHKGGAFGDTPESLEAKVVADADLLEKFGPFGVYQNVRTFTEFNWPLEKSLERQVEVLNLMMQTATGQRLADQGRQFVADFYKELAEANEPYRELA